MVFVDPSGNVAVPIVYLYLGTVLTSPDLQFDLISLQLSIAKGDYLGAAIDIASIALPGFMSFSQTRRLGNSVKNTL